MNSYYTNRIEGRRTRPHELEQALRQDLPHDSKLAARQRLAIAHIEAESEFELRYAGDVGAASLYAPAVIADIHRALFSRVSLEDSATGEGAEIEPGAFRVREVSVGRHVAPTINSLNAFLLRRAQVYGGVRRGDAALVALAADHQRLGWIHLFVDENRWVMRLCTHTLLSAVGYMGGHP